MLGFSFLGLGLPSNDHRAEHGDCQGFSRRQYPLFFILQQSISLHATFIERGFIGRGISIDLILKQERRNKREILKFKR